MKKIKVLQLGIAAILLLCAVLSSCSNNQKQKRRYFFVGYDVGTPTIRSVGNFYSNGEFKNVDYYRQVVYDMLKCEYDIKIEQCMITGFYEFKDSIEYNQFKNGRQEFVFDCGTSVYK